MDLEERVRRLEELVAVLAAGKLAAIETNCLKLVNPQGQVQGVFAAGEEAMLALADPNSESTIAFGVGKSGSHMQFVRGNGETGITMAVDESGLSVFEMCDRKSNPRFSVTIDDSGPHVQLLDANRKPRIELVIVNGHTPSIVLKDEQGKMRMMLDVQGTADKSSNLVLRDAAGQVCGMWDVDAVGKVRFLIGDVAKSQIMMNVKPDSSELVFGDQGQLRAAMGLAAGTKDPYLSLHNDQSQPRVTLGVGETHSGLAVNDSHGTNRLMTIVDSDERPWFFIRDDHQRDRLKMTIMPDGSSGISLHDPQGNLVALFTGGSRNMASLLVKDATGRSQAMLVFGPEGPVLVMTDESGQPIFTAP